MRRTLSTSPRRSVGVRHLHLDRLVAARLVVQRLRDHAVAARAAEAAAAVGRDLRAHVAPQPVQRQVGALADRVPQRDVERRLRHGDDAAAAVGHGRLPDVLPDAFDRGRVLADHARDDGFLERGVDGAQPRPEREQVAHADDAALGLDLEHQQIARVAEGVALEPRRLGPRHAQDRRADGGDGHVGHGKVTWLDCHRRACPGDLVRAHHRARDGGEISAPAYDRRNSAACRSPTRRGCSCCRSPRPTRCPRCRVRRSRPCAARRDPRPRSPTARR